MIREVVGNRRSLFVRISDPPLNWLIDAGVMVAGLAMAAQAPLTSHETCSTAPTCAGSGTRCHVRPPSVVCASPSSPRLTSHTLAEVQLMLGPMPAGVLERGEKAGSDTGDQVRPASTDLRNWPFPMV